MNTLEIFTEHDDLRTLYETRCNHATDSGFDLYIPETCAIKYGNVSIIDLKIKCRMLNADGKTIAYYIYPRSSISTTPLQLANSVGIIDRDYRGNLKIALRCCIIQEGFLDRLYAPTDPSYRIERYTRLVQICSPTLEPFNVRLVSSFENETARGEGGFGSTT